MKQTRAKQAKTERINLCLTREDREKLAKIAQREDRNLGYLATWFVEWGINLYSKLGVSLVELKDTKVVRDKDLRKRAEQRLMLREEAHSLNEELSGSSPERKRA
jgi:hypothetical protein